ncbi:DUF3667 domain-containing protein [Sphingomonas morindae]|uniref:DUF3667 domain-containing protein n=1 Tax=Sphingomonas morindae TaxID=1541170 RepID=A0ABY4X908_9SPHN|nr:DUF3667 domain-containing protein [Sphingomonas morindae]USI73390.1 DUF3667 domain-containing protein [Sphingomonas morindae]
MQGAGETMRAAQGQAVAADGHSHESACLNCGTRLIGSHCHGCGQAAHVHRTLGAFFHDLLHGVFHFEGRVWRTLPLLAWHPGTLTRAYVAGRRASYVSPIALFLFCVFLMFTVFHATEDHAAAGPHGASPEGARAAETRLETSIGRAERARRDAAGRGEPTQEMDAALAEQRAALAVLRRYGATTAPRAGAAPDEPLSLDIKIAPLRHAIETFQANPDLAIYKIQTYAYKYSWALIPISVPFLWLLFPFSRRFHLYDHTVFVTYSLCFMTLLVVVAMIAGAIGLGGLGPLLFFVPPFHMYRQLREAYGLGRASALLRTALLLLFALCALALFFVLIMAQSSL